ncbi:MAG: tRNA pseudouridine55 synthase [Actinomycetota bacterium]
MIDGFVVVDKPAGWTSHDAVARCRKIFHQKRVGHAGTLDPDATGVLLVGLGRATRLLKFVGDLEKAYVGDVVLGSTTSTLDAAGEVTATFEMSDVTRDDVANAAAKFVGDIEQIPPMVSAVQIGGKRLHALAREGIEVERAPRPVTIHSIDVIGEPGPGVFTLDVVCSTGTYIRTLADDIGRALGGGAHLRNLRRRAIGTFAVDDAVPLEQLIPENARPASELVVHLPSVTANETDLDAISHGRPLLHEISTVIVGPVAIKDPQGELIAVYRHDDGRLVADVVLLGN